MAIFVTAEPFHPGEYLSDMLTALSWTHDDLSAVTGISRRQIINLIQGKSGITPETAIKLAAAFGEGHDAMGWMNLQSAYELSLTAQKDRGIERRAAIFKWMPVRELKRRGWITELDNVAALESDVCRLAQTPGVNEPSRLRVVARKSTTYETETGTQLAWYGRIYQLAQGAPAARYSAGNIDAGLPDLLKLAAYPEDARRVPKVLAEMGIRLVLVEHLRHTKVDGAALWLDEERESSPVIGLSLRYDRIDNFWFTLLHEIMHLKNKDEPHIDEDTLSIQRRDDLPPYEIRANREAADKLIAPQKLEQFIATNKPFYYEARIVQFAQHKGVHPGIVVGQLQNHPKSGFDFKQLRKLLANVREFLLGNAITDGWKFRPSN